MTMGDSTVELAEAFRTDAETMREECIAFVRSTIADAEVSGVVVRLDGGLESTVAAAIAVEALGISNVFGLALPSSKIGSKSAQDAEAVADLLGIEHETVHLQPLLLCFGELATHTDLHGDPIVRENLVDRLRMTMLYLAADATGRLVLGTMTRSERLLGSFTRYGDEAADLLPLGGLYRTEIEALADELAVPSFVTETPAAIGFYPGQSESDDLDAPQSVIDAVLRELVETDDAPERIAAALDVDLETVERIVRRHEASEQARRWQPMQPRR